jgi:hypothetical protein
MKNTIQTKYLGHNFSLTFESDVEEDLSEQEVEARITTVMRRELQRFAEISAVAVNDKKAAAKERDRINELKRSKAKRGPAQILAAGTKGKEGRIVVQ